MLAHKPVIGSDHGGLKEIILHDATGMLVEPSNVSKLEEAIEKLAENAVMRHEFGERGYERAVAEFSLEKYLNGMIKVFGEMH
jgi:glycosyltransferase involved in cell wall biosynthesis